MSFYKKAQMQIILNPKTICYTLGGALIGNFIFKNMEAVIIGGIIGLILSFIESEVDGCNKA